MLRLEIIAAGKMKGTPFAPLWDDYSGRLRDWSITLTEIDTRDPAEDLKRLGDKLDPRAYLFVLDEKGKSLRSVEFSTRLDNLVNEGRNHIQFLIGGADGLTQELRSKADFLLSFGVQTWPHMMARVMLAEQIYRARQIIAGHPYHRES